MIRVSSKGQIVLPKRFRDKMGLQEGDYVVVYQISDGVLVLGKQGSSPIEPILEEFRQAAEAASFTREDLEQTIKEIRREKKP